MKLNPLELRTVVGGIYVTGAPSYVRASVIVIGHAIINEKGLNRLFYSAYELGAHN